jgi:hypothetical protein
LNLIIHLSKSNVTSTIAAGNPFRESPNRFSFEDDISRRTRVSGPIRTAANSFEFDYLLRLQFSFRRQVTGSASNPLWQGLASLH